MKHLYKYPQKAFPSKQLVEATTKRSLEELEYEMEDTQIFGDNCYSDIFVEMAEDSNNAEELLFRVPAYNRGHEPAALHIIPHFFFSETLGIGGTTDISRRIQWFKTV